MQQATSCWQAATQVEAVGLPECRTAPQSVLAPFGVALEAPNTPDVLREVRSVLAARDVRDAQRPQAFLQAPKKAFNRVRGDDGVPLLPRKLFLTVVHGYDHK